MKNQSINTITDMHGNRSFEHSPVEKAQHTPGPWKHEIWDYSHAARPHKELNVVDGKHLIASVSWDEGKDNPYTIPDAEARANAALISSAPDLLAALENIIRANDSPPGATMGEAKVCEAYAFAAREAINKARGISHD